MVLRECLSCLSNYISCDYSHSLCIISYIFSIVFFCSSEIKKSLALVSSSPFILHVQVGACGAMLIIINVYYALYKAMKFSVLIKVIVAMRANFCRVVPNLISNWGSAQDKKFLFWNRLWLFLRRKKWSLDLKVKRRRYVFSQCRIVNF